MYVAAPNSRGGASFRVSALDFPQCHTLDPMIRAFLENETCTLARWQDVLFEVLEVDCPPDLDSSRLGRLWSEVGIPVEISCRVPECGRPQLHEPGHVPFLDHSRIGVDVDREIEEIRHERDCLAVPRQSCRLQNVKTLHNQDIGTLHHDLLPRKDVVV